MMIWKGCGRKFVLLNVRYCSGSEEGSRDFSHNRWHGGQAFNLRSLKYEVEVLIAWLKDSVNNASSSV
jgi:hypothetical protein